MPYEIFKQAYFDFASTTVKSESINIDEDRLMDSLMESNVVVQDDKNPKQFNLA